MKKYGKILLLPVMVGGAALLADGVLTPAVTVTTAVEGLRSIPSLALAMGNIRIVIAITLLITVFCFLYRGLGQAP